jgi:HlyD family secretion protein
VAQTASSQADQETATVTRGSLRASVSANGSLAAARSVSLAFSTSGRVTEVLVKEGDQVKAGQALVKLDTAELTLSVAQAEASLASAQAQLADLLAPPTKEELAAAEASLASAQAQYRKTAKAKTNDEIIVAATNLKKTEASLAQAQAAYDKVKDQPNIGMLPQSLDLQKATLDYENAQANYRISTKGATAEELAIAQASVDNAQAQLDKIKAAPSAENVAIRAAAVTQAQISLDTARLRLTQATLTAPFAGTVTDVNVEVGAMAGGAAVTLTDLSQMSVDVRLNENDVAKIALGQRATVTVDAFPKVTLTGAVTYIAATSQTQSGVVLYPVTITLDPVQPGVALRAGMTAAVETTVAEKADVLKLPLAALRNVAGQSVVLKKAPPGQAQPPATVQPGQPGLPGFISVPVTVGATMAGEAEILSGLAEGDVVSIASLTTSAQTKQSAGFFGGQGGPGGFSGGQPQMP